MVFKKFYKLNPLKISLIISLITVVAYLSGVHFFDVIELKTLDYRFLIRGEKNTGNEVAIVSIDEESLDKLGKWPWPRKRIAELIDSLGEYDVNSIGFDVVFAEPDYNSESILLNNLYQNSQSFKIKDNNFYGYLKKLIRENDNDAILASAIKRSGRVILGYFFHTTDEGLEHLKGEAGIQIGHLGKSGYTQIEYISPLSKDIQLAKENFSVEQNLPLLSEKANGFGYFNIFPDFDGTVRWAPMIMMYQGEYFPPLSVELARHYLGNPPIKIVAADYGIDKIKLGGINIPTDEDGNLLINYLGRNKTFPHYSVYDVINKNVPEDDLKNKIVLVGATAIGIYDMRVTPFGSVYPGVEIHANIIDNILHQNFILRPDWISFLDLLIIIAVGLLLGTILPKLGPTPGAVTVTVIFLLFSGANYYLFSQLGLWLNYVYPTFSFFSVYICITLFQYLTVERKRKVVKNAFQYYMTSSVVNEILKDPTKLKLGGEKKILSVLFSDIRSFTKLSENMSPEELVHFLNQYLTTMTDIVFKYEGVLDKYMGDAIMSIYGAPVDQKDHPLRACWTALDMMKELSKLHKLWEKKNLPKINIGIGISTGPMVVGNMGSERRFDYTVMGDTVNLGERLEGANKVYGTNIIISEDTYNNVKTKMICREIDVVRVKGKDKPVKIFELLGEKGKDEINETVVKKFETALDLYRGMELPAATEAFREVLKIKVEDPVSKVYLDRCQLLAKSPPPSDWDGVFNLTTK